MGAPGGSAGYVGPGDVVSGAWGWWGLRCYNAAYSGNVADVFDTATGTTTETLLTCSAGGIMNQTINALSVTCAIGCSIKILYDQSGNTNCSINACDFGTSAPVSSWPVLSLNCLGALPCMTFNGTSSRFQAAHTPTTLAQPLTISASAVRSTGTGEQNILSSNSGNATLLEFHNAANGADIYSGSTNFLIVPGVTDGTWHAFQGIFCSTASSPCSTSGNTSNLNVNGSDNTGNISNSSLSANLFMGNDLQGSWLNGRIVEAGVWPFSFSSANNSAMSTNQRSYWGF